MRKTLTATAALAAVLVGACGDDNEDLSTFCRAAQDVNQELTDADDPSAAVDELGELDPPEEIAEDWQIFVDGIPLYANPDESEEGQSSNLEEAEQFDQNLERYQQAQRTVFSYLRDECEIDISS